MSSNILSTDVAAHIFKRGTICAILVEGITRNTFVKNILNLDMWFSRCCFKIFLIYISGGLYIWQSKTIYPILVEGIMLNTSVFWSVAREKMYFKDISHPQLWRPLRDRVGQFISLLFLHLSCLCKIILNLNQVIRRRCHLKIFLI